MFANAVFINQGRGGEYGLGKQTGEMRNLKKKLLSFQNPHCNLLLPLFECFLGWFMVCFFCLVVGFFFYFYLTLPHPLLSPCLIF